MKTLGLGILVFVLVACCALGSIGLYVVSVDNSIQLARVDIGAKAGQIQVVLQRRYDLVTQEVATINGLTAQERYYLDTYVKQAAALAGSLNQYAQTGTGGDQVQQQLQATDKAFADVKAYVLQGPEMKSDKAFEDFMILIEGNENRIAIARRDYNLAVQDYRNLLVTFPASAIANARGYKVTDFAMFEADSAAQTAPTINFGTPAKPAQ